MGAWCSVGQLDAGSVAAAPVLWCVFYYVYRCSLDFCVARTDGSFLWRPGVGGDGGAQANEGGG